MNPTRPEFSAHAYIVDLPAVVESINRSLDGHGNPRDYLGERRRQIEQTDLYKNYRSRLNEIGGRAIIMSGMDNRRNLMETSTVLSDPSFDDGFMFGMVVNGTLLATKQEKSERNITAVNVLNPALNKILDGFEEMIENGTDLDWEVGKYGMTLYCNSTVHPDDKHFDRIRQHRNPLDRLVNHLCFRTYIAPVLGGSSLAKSNALAATNRFKQGFGYARSAYTDYTLTLNQQLQERFDETPSVDDSSL